MGKDKDLILWFEMIRRQDTAIVGGKTASLGELTSETAVPVPYGFAATAYAYRYFMKESGLDKKISELLEQLTDVENSLMLRKVSALIRKEIIKAEMPEKLRGFTTLCG